MKKRLLAVGSFPAITTPRDEISDRILGTPKTDYFSDDDTLGFQEEVAARHFSPAAVRAATVALLRPEAPIYAPPQYQVFNLSRHRHCFINFNNDGLVDKYCGHHTIVNVHGTSLSVDDRFRLDWDAYITLLQHFHEIRDIEIPGLLLPQREPEHIETGNEYRIARKLLRSARRLIIVGYSFGGMDDWVAYDMVTSAIKSRCLVTSVVSLDPYDLAFRIAGDCASAPVMALPVYWDKLAMAILASIGQPKYKSCMHGRRFCIRCVDYLYSAFLEQSSQVGRLFVPMLQE